MTTSARERAHAAGCWVDVDGGRCDPEVFGEEPDGDEEVHCDSCDACTAAIEAAERDAVTAFCLKLMDGCAGQDPRAVAYHVGRQVIAMVDIGGNGAAVEARR